jgi:hypothetical protein
LRTSVDIAALLVLLLDGAQARAQRPGLARHVQQPQRRRRCIVEVLAVRLREGGGLFLLFAVVMRSENIVQCDAREGSDGYHHAMA